VRAEAGERRIPVGPFVGLAGAALLFVSLFLDWWEGTAAFTAFEVLDLMLVALVAAEAVVLAGLLGARLPGLEPAPGLALAAGLAALVIVVSQLLNDPPAIAGTGRGTAAGIWIGLGGSLLMLASGGLVAARIAVAVHPTEERFSRRPRGRVAEPPPEPAAAAMRRRAAARARAAPESGAKHEPQAEPTPPGDGREP
jgi:hypothetical protein